VISACLVVAAGLYGVVWSLSQATLPFYVHDIHRGADAATVRWIGLILGAPFPLTIVTTPLWIRAARKAPRGFYVTSQLLQGVGFAVTGFCEDVRVLVVVRACLGALGPTTVFGLMIVARLEPAVVTARVARMQAAAIVGQVLGPAVGAAVCARFGFTACYAGAGAVLGACAALAILTVPALSAEAPPPAGPRPAWGRQAVRLALLLFTAYSLVSFFSAMLPTVLGGSEMHAALPAAGAILFASSASFAGGMLIAPRLGAWLGERRAMRHCHAVACLTGMLLAWTPAVWSLAGVRTVETFLLGPVISLATSQAVTLGSPQALGILNSARMAANFAGPVAATLLLASMSTAHVFVVLSAVALLGLAGVPRR
jgi:MFS family permease